MIKHVSKLCTKTITANTLSEMLTDDCDVSTGSADAVHTSAVAAGASGDHKGGESGSEANLGSDSSRSRKRPTFQRKNHENRSRKRRASFDRPVIDSSHVINDNVDERNNDGGDFGCENVDICGDSDGDDAEDETPTTKATSHREVPAGLPTVANHGPNGSLQTTLHQGVQLSSALDGESRSKIRHVNPLDSAWPNSIALRECHVDLQSECLANGRSPHRIGNTRVVTSATACSTSQRCSPPCTAVVTSSTALTPHTFSIESLTANLGQQTNSSADGFKRRFSHPPGLNVTDTYVYHSDTPSDKRHTLSPLREDAQRHNSLLDRLSPAGGAPQGEYMGKCSPSTTPPAGDADRQSASPAPSSPSPNCDELVMKRRKPSLADAAAVIATKNPRDGSSNKNGGDKVCAPTTPPATTKRNNSSRPSFLISDILGVKESRDQNSDEHFSSNTKPTSSSPLTSNGRHEFDNNNQPGLNTRHHIGVYSHHHHTQHHPYSHQHHHQQQHQHHHPHPYSLYNSNATANMAASAALALGAPYNFVGLNPNHPVLSPSYQRPAEGRQSPHNHSLPPGLDPSHRGLDSSYEDEMLREDDDDNDEDEGDDGRDNDSISEGKSFFIN